MSKKFLNDIDMDQNQVLNMRVQNLESAPSNAKEGQIYYDSTTKRVYKYNGTKWEALSEVVLIQYALINLEAGCDPQDIYNAFTNSENATKEDAEAVLAKIQSGTPTFIIKEGNPRSVNIVIPVTTYIMASRRIILNFILQNILYYFTIFTNIITKSDWGLPTKNKRVYGLVPEDELDSDSTTTALSANQGRILNEKITSLTTYSTEETRIGTWIDGKPLYRKVISSTLPKVTTEDVGVTKTVSIDADIRTGFIETAYFNKDNQMLPMPFIFTGGQIIKSYMSLNGTITLWSNTTYVNEQPVTIIVCYTKTTD